MGQVSVEPFLFTSLQTRGGRTGYQLAVQGKRLLRGAREREGMLNLLSTLVDQLAGTVPDGFLLYRPLSEGLAVFVRAEAIRDWQGRPGVCCSALVFDTGTLPPAAQPMSLHRLFRAKKLYLGQNDALAFVEKLKEGEDLPVNLGARQLEPAADGDAADGWAALTGKTGSVCAAAEKLVLREETVHLRGSLADESYLTAVFHLLPPKARFRLPFVLACPKNLSVPFRLIVWAGDVPEIQRDQETRADSKPTGETARKLLDGLSGGRRTPDEGPAWLAKCAGGGRSLSAKGFWEFLLDDLRYRPLLETPDPTQCKPRDYARALRLLWVSSRDETAAYCERACPKWEGDEAWLESLRQALADADPELYRKGFLEGLHRSWSGRVAQRPLRDWLQTAKACGEDTLPVLRSALKTALKKGTASPDAEDLDALFALDPPAERRKWASVIITHDPEAFLRWPRFDKEAAHWIEGLPERDRALLWKAVIASGDENRLRAALRNPALAGCMDADDFATVEEHFPDTEFDALKDWGSLGAAELTAFYEKAQSPRAKYFLRNRLRPRMLELEVPVLWRMLKEELGEARRQHGSAQDKKPKVEALLRALAAKMNPDVLRERLGEPGLKNELYQVQIPPYRIDELLARRPRPAPHAAETKRRSGSRRRKREPFYSRWRWYLAGGGAALLLLAGVVGYIHLKPQQPGDPAAEEWRLYQEEQGKQLTNPHRTARNN